MTKIECQNINKVNDLKVYDIYGFITDTGVHIIDEECENIVSLWDNGEVTVTGGIRADMILNNAIYVANLCSEDEIKIVLYSQDDIDITFAVNSHMYSKTNRRLKCEF